MPGSSPRTRGTPSRRQTQQIPRRFIPAHAGNTPLASTTLGVAAVHPRARGEHSLEVRNHSIAAGSSPRTRGTRTQWAFVLFAARFIPAHAGNTSLANSFARRSAVHPRARGEHTEEISQTQFDGGSSPRTRGTHLLPRLKRRFCWFIPAHAGNTACRPRRMGKATVHPRARGEH